MMNDFFAKRIIAVIDESLAIAKKTKNDDTRESRLNVAKAKLEDLKRLEKDGFVTQETVLEVEKRFKEKYIEATKKAPVKKSSNK